MTTVGGQFSETRLAQPAILVVGDSSSYFSSEVWKGVVAESGRTAYDWSNVQRWLGQTPEQLGAEFASIGLDWRRRPLLREPVPIQVTHAHDPSSGWLRETLGKLLDWFDVWGIVASASAGDVKPLRNVLRGVDVPLLVTTDSTTVKKGGHFPNELRLMPSNKGQATAMLFTAVRSGRQQSRGSESPRPHAKPQIAYSLDNRTQSREYVQDLRAQLLTEAERLDVQLVQYQQAADHSGPLIVVGYSEHAHEIIASRNAARLTIFSDGCATRDVHDAVVRLHTDIDIDTAVHRTDGVDSWYLSRPSVELVEIGRKCFSALVEAGRQIVGWDPDSHGEELLRVSSWRDVTQQILAETDPALFSFEGIENVASAYRVSPIVSHDDLRDDGPAGQPEIGAKIVELPVRRS